MPVEVDFFFCMSDGQKSLLCQFFSVYLFVLKDKTFLIGASILVLYLSYVDLPPLVFQCDIASTTSSPPCSDVVFSWNMYTEELVHQCLTVCFHRGLQFCVKPSNAVLCLHRNFLSWFWIQFSCVFSSIKWNFQTCTPAVSLWRSCCSPLAFPSAMSSLAPVYWEHIGRHPLSWKGYASWAHCRCWICSLAGELRGWDGSRQKPLELHRPVKVVQLLSRNRWIFL